MTGVNERDGTFRIRRVPVAQPREWLSRGLKDLLQHSAASLAYGALVSGIGAVILVLLRHPYLIAAAISGFLFLGPILATGLCELSRQRDAGGKVNFENSLDAMARNQSSLFTYALCLLGLGVAWFLLSVLILYLSFGSNVAPSVGMPLWGSLISGLSALQIVSYLFVGGVLATAVFVLSVVTIPLLIDRPIDAFEAMRTSVRVTMANRAAMAVWGAMIVVLTGIGFATFLLGMVVVFPLLGHATWHAYKDLLN